MSSLNLSGKFAKNISGAYAALGLSILALGVSPIMLKMADAPGTVSMFYRMGTAVLLMAFPFYRDVKSQRSFSWKGAGMAILGGLFFSLDLAFWSTGVMLSGVAKPTLLSNTAPLWVGLGAMLLFREKLSPWFWGGLALALCGAVMVLDLNPLYLTQIEPGSLFGLISAFFYGAYFLATQSARKSLNSLTCFWIASLSSAAALLVYVLGLNLPLTGYSLASYLLFGAMGIIGQIAGFLLINYALGYLPASVVSPTLLLQPVITTLLAAALLGESYSGVQIAGGVAVLAGVFIVQSVK